MENEKQQDGIEERANVVRESYCLVCGHEAFQHEIGMNTPQTGRCLERGCDCIRCDTPSRHDLGEEVERLLAETATLSAKLDATIAALGELVDVKGSPIKSWAAIGEDFEFWWGKHSDLITTVLDADDKAGA